MASPGLYNAAGKSTKSKEEQDMADFLSSFDQLTADKSYSRISGGDGGDSNSNSNSNSPSFGTDFFFDLSSTFTGKTHGNHAGGRAAATAHSANVVSTGKLREEPDWLKEFQALDVNGKGDGAPPAASPSPKTTMRHATAGAGAQLQQEEILGLEPEILDEDLYTEVTDDGYGHNSISRPHAATSHLSPSSDPTRSLTSIRTFDTNIGGGDGGNGSGSGNPSGRTDWPPTNSDTPLQTATPNTSLVVAPAEALWATGAAEAQLDWPGTLDTLGLAEPEGRPQPNPNQGPGPSSRVVPGLPVSRAAGSLTTIPPLPAKADTFPDFIDVRDPKHVSQWPKLGAPGSANDRGAGGAGDEVPADGGSTAPPSRGGGVTKGPGGAGKQQGLPVPLRTVEVYLRPDVTWESVSDVYMAVMLSRGLIVREQTDKMVSKN